MKIRSRIDSLPKEFLTCLFSSFACYTSMAIFFLYPLILSLKGYSPLSVGLAWISFEIALIGSRPWSNAFLHRYGTRKGLLTGGLIMASGITILNMMPPFYLILIGRLIQGTGWGLFILANNIHNAKVLPPEIRGAGFGLAGLAPILPQLTFFPLAEWLVLEGYLRLTIFVALMACVISLFLAKGLSQQNEKATPRIPLLTVLNMAWKNGNIRAILLSASAFAMLSAPVLPYMANGAREWGSYGSAFLLPASGVSILIRLFISRMVDRFETRLLKPGFYCAATGLITACWGRSTGALITGGVLFGLGTGILYPLLFAQMSKLTPRELMTPMFTLFNTFLDAVWVLAPLAAAGLAQFRSYGWMLQFISLLIILYIFSLRLWVWPLIKLEGEG